MMPFQQDSKEWWASSKQKKRNKGQKRKEWWARRQGWSTPPPDTGASSSAGADTGASSSAGGKGPTIIETPGLQASFRINSFALQVLLGHSILLHSYRKLTQWFGQHTRFNKLTTK